MSKPDRAKKLDKAHPDLSVRKQCKLLSLARSGVYRQCKGSDTEELALTQTPRRWTSRRCMARDRRADTGE